MSVGSFTLQDAAFLDEVADTILPTTARSRGAKAAGTGAFMALMVTDANGKRQGGRADPARGETWVPDLDMGRG